MYNKLSLVFHEEGFQNSAASHFLWIVANMNRDLKRISGMYPSDQYTHVLKTCRKTDEHIW